MCRLAGSIVIGLLLSGCARRTANAPPVSSQSPRVESTDMSLAQDHVKKGDNLHVAGEFQITNVNTVYNVVTLKIVAIDKDGKRRIYNTSNTSAVDQGAGRFTYEGDIEAKDAGQYKIEA